MAYDKDELLKQAEVAIKEKKLHFIEDIIACLPCDKTTFYRKFQKDSNEYNDLKELLTQNRTEQKQKLRKKWSDSDNATLQLSLYKLIGTDEDRQKLSQSHLDIKSDGEQIGLDINFVKREKKAD